MDRHLFEPDLSEQKPGENIVSPHALAMFEECSGQWNSNPSPAVVDGHRTTRPEYASDFTSHQSIGHLGDRKRRTRAIVRCGLLTEEQLER